MDKLLLTTMEAADVLGVGRSKVYELMRAGALASVRIDSCRRIPVEDLSALVSRLRAAGSDQHGEELGARGSERLTIVLMPCRHDDDQLSTVTATSTDRRPFLV